MGRVKVWGSQRAGISSSAQGAAYRVQRAVMCDDVTDDVCRGCLLIALPSKTGPDIDDGESTWSCEVRYRGGRVRTVGRAPGAVPSTLDAGVQACLLARWLWFYS